MRLPDDKDLGPVFTVVLMVLLLGIGLLLFSFLVVGPALQAKIETLLLAQFGLLGALITLKTMAVGRGRRDGDRGD